jgi:hypothetical protein
MGVLSVAYDCRVGYEVHLVKFTTGGLYSSGDDYGVIKVFLNFLRL